MQRLKAFFHKESAASLTLLTMTLLAMVGANSPFVHYYDTLHSHNAVLIINEGLMALFFLCIGIEIKHEIKEGHLKTHAQRMLPLVAAFGGMAFPAAIYSYLNWGNASMRGWAIPTATDIAFSLGVLGIFGKRISPALRIFLMSIAVFDDLMAIIVIAIFYTKQIYWQALVFAAGCCFLLLFYNRKAASLVSFLLLGCALWSANACISSRNAFKLPFTKESENSKCEIPNRCCCATISSKMFWPERQVNVG
jgi:NhaA family Na+:H+ antiporter